MRIVFLNPSGQLGGAERMLLDVVSSLRAMPEVRSHVLLGEEGPLVERLQRIGVATSVLKYPASLARLGDAAVNGLAGDRVGRGRLALRLLIAAPGTIRYALALRGRLRELRPDIVHTNGFKMHLLGSVATPQEVPVVWHMHDYLSARPVMSRLLAPRVSRVGAIVANSYSVAEDIASVCGGSAQVFTVPNAIDLREFTPEGPTLDIDDICGLPPAEEGTLRIGLVATLGRWKGHAVFLRALSLLPRDGSWRGYIVGGALYQTGGSQYSLRDLRELRDKLGLQHSVGFTGFVERPATAMRALDVVVHASTQPEPFGLVIAEAMACGRTLVASQAGGSAELFEDGIEALGCRPTDAEGLASRLEEVLRDPALRERLGVQARLSAEKRFDRARLAGELMPIYRRLLSR